MHNGLNTIVGFYFWSRPAKVILLIKLFELKFQQNHYFSFRFVPKIPNRREFYCINQKRNQFDEIVQPVLWMLLQHQICKLVRNGVQQTALHRLGKGHRSSLLASESVVRKRWHGQRTLLWRSRSCLCFGSQMLFVFDWLSRYRTQIVHIGQTQRKRFQWIAKCDNCK